MVNYTPAVVGKSQENSNFEKGSCVNEYMTRNFKTINESNTILEAAEVLIKNDLSGAPVVDKYGEMIGFLSEKDCLKYVLDSKYYNHAPSSVTHYMSTHVMAVSPKDSLTQLVELFLRNSFHVYPVIEEGRVVGTVTRRTALKAISELNESSW